MEISEGRIHGKIYIGYGKKSKKALEKFLKKSGKYFEKKSLEEYPEESWTLNILKVNIFILIQL